MTESIIVSFDGYQAVWNPYTQKLLFRNHELHNIRWFVQCVFSECHGFSSSIGDSQLKRVSINGKRIEECDELLPYYVLYGSYTNNEIKSVSERFEELLLEHRDRCPESSNPDFYNKLLDKISEMLEKDN